MFRSMLSHVVALATVTMPVVLARGADAYLNQTIVPRLEHLTAWVEGMPTGTEVDFNWPANVERVNGQWLWITDDGTFNIAGRPIKGWVSKYDVMLLDNDPIIKKTAIDYLTDFLEHDPNAGWAYWLRGKVLRNNGDWRKARLDLLKATERSPWLDDAWESLAYCEYQQAFEENKDVFTKIRDHKQICLAEAELPPLIKDSIDHFQHAATLRPRPNTFCEWGDALAIRTWNQFHRQTWIFYMEDPEQYSQQSSSESCKYIEGRRRMDPFKEGSFSAPCLYDHALAVCPQFAVALYDRATLYEYAADFRIYMMTQESKWKALTHADKIASLRSKQRKKEDEVAAATADAQPDLDALDRLTGIAQPQFNESRIKIYETNRKKNQAKLDKLQRSIDHVKQLLKTELASVEKNSKTIDSRQSEILEQIKHLTDSAIDDYGAAIAADPKYITANRDLAAMYLILINPTGRHRIDSKSHRGAALAARAASFAGTAAKLNDYEDTASLITLPTWAAALYETASYDDAIRRESADGALMDEEQRAIARDFIDLCNAAKKAALRAPK